MVESLSVENIPIISGMAKGIDGYAHTVALNNNNYTIAVLGTGIDKCYPKEHITLMNKIIEKGAVISQFEPGITNIKENFLKRNELIAMLSEKIVVVQASKDSGALYTAKFGMKCNKQVYSVPGSIYDRCNDGTNMLIYHGAKVYTSPRDIVKEMSIITDRNSMQYNEFEDKIIRLLDKKPMSLDNIKYMIGLNSCNIDEAIIEMEIKGYIKQIGGVFRCQHTFGSTSEVQRFPGTSNKFN